MMVRIKGIPARRISLMLRAFQQLTLMAGLCLGLWPCYVMAESRWVQYVGAMQVAAARRDQQETIVPPKPSGSGSRTPVQRGKVLGQFEVPRLKLSYVLLEGTDNRTLDKSIGHVVGTGLPGESGNISIAGHRNTHFRKLEWIRRGDEIVLTSPRGQYRYQVEWLRLFRPDDIEVIDAGHGPAVTLITCFPFEYVGSAPLLYIVRALPDDETRQRLSPMSSNATQSGQ